MPAFMKDFYDIVQAGQQEQLNKQSMQQNDQTLAQNAIKLQQLQKGINDEEAINKLKTEAYNRLYNKQIPSAPVGLNPGEVEQTNTQVTQARSNPFMDAESTSKDIDKAVENISYDQQVIHALKTKGYHKEAERLEGKMLDHKKTLEDTTKAHLENVIKLSEHTSNIAAGFLNALKDPNVDPDAAWNRTVMHAISSGADPEEFANIAPEERKAYAEQIVNEGISAKDRAKSSLELMKEKGRKERADTANTIKENALEFRRKAQASREDREKRLDKFRETKFNTSEERRAHKQQFEELKTVVKGKLDIAKEEINNYDNDLEAARDALLTLQKGNMLLDSKGQPLGDDEESIQREELIYTKRINEALSKRQEAQEELKKLKEEFSNLENIGSTLDKDVVTKSATSKEKPTTKEPSTAVKPKTTSKLPPKNIQEAFFKDPATKGMMLGNETSQGWEVKDQKGKVVGHYRID